MRIKISTVYKFQLWYLTRVSALSTVESNVIVTLGAGFYEETCVWVFTAGVRSYKIRYIEFTVAIAWQGAGFQGQCGIWSAALQYTVFIIPIPSRITPGNVFVLFIPAYIARVPCRSRSINLNNRIIGPRIVGVIPEEGKGCIVYLSNTGISTQVEP